ncbi:MAG: hypothetical protein PHG60_00435 [Candidatus Dojkabacteria bacterium]|nr:hypothetical protein [Candidatus Dojkabacteria bacterium]
MSKYDVIVVGAGPAGMFATYELIRNHPKCKKTSLLLPSWLARSIK